MPKLAGPLQFQDGTTQRTAYVGGAPVVVPGAVGDGVTDDTAALQAAFNTAGGNWLLERGKTYRHTGGARLNIAGAGTGITGYGATLLSDNPDFSALRVNADGCTIRGLTHRVTGATARGNGQNVNNCPFVIDTCANTTLIDCTSQGAKDSGVFLFNANGFAIRNLTIEDSLADGLHITSGSSNGVADGVYVANPGDDGVAVVSYTADAGTCSNIRVNNIVVLNGQARGVSIVGGVNVHYAGVRIHRSRASALYIAQENNAQPTKPCTNCRISSVQAYDTAWDDGQDFGVILMVAQTAGGLMTSCIIEGVEIHDQRRNGYNLVYAKIGANGGSGGDFVSSALRDVNFYTTAPPTLPGALYVDGVNNTTVTVDNFTYQSATGTGVTQTADGFTVAGAGAQVTNASSSSSSPGLTVSRVRLNQLLAIDLDGGTT